MKNIKKFDEFINEGIDFDKKTMKVWFTPTEEKYVDTSLENNPTIDKEIMTDVEVWSIFRRAKDGKKDDGNPLIYALKGEKGWEFREESDREAIEKQFELIAEKFAKTHPIGVTILIPSGNQLNRHIAEVIMSKSKDSHLIEGAISKLTVEEVDEIVLKKDSKFRSFYGDDFDEAYNRLESFF